MILSHEHKFIFLKTTKVGGSSLEIALSKFCGPMDVITSLFPPEDEAKRAALGFRGAQNYTEPYPWRWGLRETKRLLLSRQSPRRYYNHMPAAAARATVGPKIWDSYYKFTLARNPFDVAVSRFFMHQHRGVASAREFRSWLTGPDARIDRNLGIYMIDGEISVDKIVPYEALEQGLHDVSAAIGLPENIYGVMRSIRAKASYRSDKASTAEMFDGFPEGVALIEKLADPEIEMFGYSPEGASRLPQS